MLQWIWSRILFRGYRLGERKKRLVAYFMEEVTEDAIRTLFEVMRLAFLLDGGLRRHIDGFGAKYLFRSKNSEIAVSAVFNGGEMVVSERVVEDPTTTVIFEDYTTLGELLPPNQPDILRLMLEQQVVVEGNLNYFYKFAYMASLFRPPGL